MKKLLVTLIGSSFILSACGNIDNSVLETKTEPKEKYIYQKDFGDKWPLSIPSCYLSCYDFKITCSYQGEAYAVNGIARQSKNPVYKPIDSVWLDNPNIKGAKIDISPVMEAGQKLCEE